MELNDFKSNPELEEKGVWVPIGDSSRVLVASTNSAKYREFASKRLAPYKHLIAKNAFPAKEAERVMIDIFTECILLGWEGFTENGEPLPYNKENAKRALTESVRFRELISALADDATTFQRELLSEEIKNSQAASSGN